MTTAIAVFVTAVLLALASLGLFALAVRQLVTRQTQIVAEMLARYDDRLAEFAQTLKEALVAYLAAIPHTDAKAAGVGFAVCQQHFPENFWDPAFQQHGNTASGIEAAVLVAENPSEHRAFLSAFTGVHDLSVTSSGITASTPRGDISVMEPAAFRSRFGTEPPDVSRGARLAAMQFRVRDRAALSAALAAGGIATFSRMDATIVGPQTALGATLVFH